MLLLASTQILSHFSCNFRRNCSQSSFQLTGNVLLGIVVTKPDPLPSATLHSMPQKLFMLGSKTDMCDSIHSAELSLVLRQAWWVYSYFCCGNSCRILSRDHPLSFSSWKLMVLSELSDLVFYYGRMTYHNIFPFPFGSQSRWFGGWYISSVFGNLGFRVNRI